MRDSQANGKKPIKEVEKLRPRKPKLEQVSSKTTEYRKATSELASVRADTGAMLRKTGIDIIGDVAWGAHFCVFYHSKQDLIDILVPYFKAGLENNEFCMWITSEPLNAKDAKESLKGTVRNLDSYIEKGQIEILDYSQWYTKSGKFETDRVLQGWVQKHDDAIARGFDGLRLTGNTFWLEKKDWKEFTKYEESVNNIIGKYRMLAICTYSLDKCGASEVIDVVNNHQYAIVKREGLWDILESAERNKVEEALRASEKRYRDLFENAGEGIITLDLDGRITEANRLVEEYGFNRAELIGRQLFEFVPEYDKARSVSDFQALLAGRRVQGQMDVITPKGIITVEYRDTQIVRAGEVIGVQAILTDITQRKKAENEKDEFLRTIETAKEAMCIVSPSLIITYTNEAMDELFGYKKDELIGKHVSTCNAGATPEAVSREIGNSIEREGWWEGEVHNIRKDGTEFISYATTSAYRDKDGKIISFLSSQHDITQRKKAEQRLKESEERFRKIVDTAPGYLLITDQDGKNLYVSPHCEKITGYSQNELIGQIIWWVHEDDTSRAKEVFQSAYRDGRPGRNFEYKAVKKNGQVWHASTSWETIKDSKGQLKSVVVQTFDITERKKAEEAYRSLVDHSLQGLSILQDGHVVFANQALADITGYTIDELLAMSPEQVQAFIHPEDRQLVWSRYRARLNGEADPERYDFRGIRKDGSTCWLELHANRVEYQGKPAIQTAYVDITERKRAEEALRESKENYRMVSRLTSDYILTTKVEPNGQMVLVSATDRLEKMTGYAVEELRSQSSWSKIVHPDDYDKFQDFWKRIVSSRKSCELEFRGIDRKQEFEWLHAYGQPILDEKNDRVISIVFAAKDITERKLAEEAYRSLVDHSLQGLAIFQEGRVVFANQAMAEITGYTVEEMLTLPPEQVQAFVHPDDRPLVWSRHRDRLNGEELPERYEFRGIRKDGSICWVEIHASRIEYQGKPAIQAAYVDITERKRAEERIEFLSRILETSPISVIATDENVKIIYVNPATENLFGYESEELIGKDPGILNAEPDADKMQMRMLDTIRQKGIWKGELLNKKKNGERFYIQVSCCKLLDEEGNFVALVGFQEDITERKLAEEALRESEEQYRMLAETMNDGLGAIDEKGTYVYVNNKLGEILAYSPDEIVGRHWTAFFDEDAQKIINEQLTERKKGIAEPYEVINTRKDGQKIFLRISPQAIFDADGKFKGSIKIMTDITERKKTEEQIAKLAKFPAENPNPVLRISGRGTVIYANKASANLLKAWDCSVGKSLPDRWNEFVMDSLSSGQSQQTEVQCDGRIFSLTFAPVVKANYVNVYGHDITERKKAEDELRFYSEVTVNMSEGVYAIRASDGIIVYTNPKFEEMFGYGPGELIGKHVSVINAPTEKSPQETAKEIMDVLNKKGVWRGEILNIKKDGTPFWCYASVSTFEHTEHKKVWVTMHTDITERKKAEEEVQNLAKFPSENPNAVFRVSKEGNILYANRTGEILLSCRKCFDNDKTVSKEWLKIITEAFTSKSEKAFEFECKNRFYSFIIAPVAEGGYANFYGRDITKRKKAEERLLEHQAKLKAMASKMLMTEERERQRLAVGLHDEVCQKLVLTKLALESSMNLVSDSKLLASLRIVCEGIGETIEQADLLTFELSNPVLRQLGFVIALEKYLTEEIRQKHGIEYELQSDEQLSTLPDEIKNCLFRVTRELLTNVVKHAQASKVKVSVRKSQSQIYVRVQDDGVGFKESQAGAKVSQTARFGLFSIREQLEYLGGHLEIDSVPGRGTKVTVVVPLRDKAVV